MGKSYCELHNTHPADNEPCWQCITKFGEKFAGCHNDLVAACEAQHTAIDTLFAALLLKDENFMPSKSGQPWKAIKQGNAALEKAKKVDV